jgi:mono/diheme cytochrome c family protein
VLDARDKKNAASGAGFPADTIVRRRSGDSEPPLSIHHSFLLARAGVESAQKQAELAHSAGPSSQEETMRRTLLVPGAILLASIGIAYAGMNSMQEKPGSTEPKMAPEDAAKKNPVTPTPEGLAEVRKLFGYNCAMCHGKSGDGKGDLAADMKLELRDWRDASSIEKITDGELFWIISNGKGKMPGEGDRTAEKVRWNFVNLVRSFGKKGAADKPKAEAPPS